MVGFCTKPADRKGLLQAIEIASCLWGGTFFPIIPLLRRIALNEFNQQVTQAKPAKERKKPTKRAVQPAMVARQPFISDLVITIDYRDGVQAKKEQFGNWLGSGLNKKLFKKYYKRPKQDPESADHYKELLKFLAAWRLFNERDLEGAKEWTTKNRREDEKELKKRAFFREKSEKTTEADKERFGPQFFGPLYRDRRDWGKAVGKAKDFLATEIELGRSGDTC